MNSPRPARTDAATSTGQSTSPPAPVERQRLTRPADAQARAAVPTTATEADERKGPAPAKKAQEAAGRPAEPRCRSKVGTVAKPCLKRPASLDEVRCTGTNSRGLRRPLEAAANGRCQFHGSAG